MKYTLSIPDKIGEVFKEIADEEQISQSELLRKAFLTYAVLRKQVAMGKSVAIVKDGVIEKELILTLQMGALK